MLYIIKSSQSPFSLDLSQQFTELLTLEEVRLLVDTTAGPVTILLPAISTLPTQNVKIFISDYLGNAAANPITVAANGSDTIGGAGTLVINTNDGAAKLEIASFSEWLVSSGSGGGGGGGTTVKQWAITAADFTGTGANATFTDARLAGLVAVPVDKNTSLTLMVYSDAGSGALQSAVPGGAQGFSYTNNGVTGTIRAYPGNYRIVTYT